MKNIYGYDYQKPKRPDDYIPPTLSEKDQFVPKTHIGMYDILRNEKNDTVYLGEEQCQNVRKKTFNSVLAIFREYGSPSYADLWNYNISAINDCGLNYFITNPRLAPVGDLIQCFEKEYETNTGRGKFQGGKVLYVSFGIHRKKLNEYFQNVREAKKNGTEVVIPKLPKPKLKSREEVLFGQKTFINQNGKTLTIDRNAIYNRFQHWCKLNCIEEKEGLLMALETLFKCYPDDWLQESKYYNVITELDRIVFRPRIEKGTEEVTVNLSKVIYGKTQEILARYNLDPDNISKGNMDIDTYFNNALHLLNTNMPLKYQDPEFVAEKELIEKMEQESGD